jgi:hypothetical protein
MGGPLAGPGLTRWQALRMRAAVINQAVTTRMMGL